MATPVAVVPASWDRTSQAANRSPGTRGLQGQKEPAAAAAPPKQADVAAHDASIAPAQTAAPHAPQGLAIPADGAAQARQGAPAPADADQKAHGQTLPATASLNRVEQAAAHLAASSQAAAGQVVVTQAVSSPTTTAQPATPPAAVSPQASASLPAVTGRADPPGQSTPPGPAPAAAQLAPAFAALSVSAASQPGAQVAGPQSLVIRLAPAELGHVQVRVDQAADGTSHVVLAVERTDTLILLLQDRPQLNQALNAAGISPDGRTLQLSLASTGDAGASSGFGGGNGGSGPGFGGSQGGGSPGQDNSGGGQRRPSTTAWQRAGVDITA
jgi:flagellar hook-length control protein FliK